MNDVPSGSRVIDVSTPLDERTPFYPGDKRFERLQVRSIPAGDGYNLSALSMSAHSGTHIDAPLHFLDGGASIDMIDPKRLVSRAVLADFNGRDAVGRGDLEPLHLEAGDSLLIAANEHLRGGTAKRGACALTLDGAEFLADSGVNAVGIDWLSIESDDDPSYPVHHRLLAGGIIICEGLRLAGVAPGRYTLILAPLLIAGSDGAPARVLLVQDA